VFTLIAALLLQARQRGAVGLKDVVNPFQAL
jgi:hypothetical protein